MITKENEPIQKRSDGSYIIQHKGMPYQVVEGDTFGAYTIAEIDTYLAEKELVPDLDENRIIETDEMKISRLNEYLISTDWYVIRKMERGIEIPEDIAQARLDAVDEINRLKD